MPTLSLAMIVKDEETTLGHCLASVKGLVDEMVVVDTGSTDGTRALAESFGARVAGFPWADDFGAARNESLRLCTGDWVLILDADEAVDPMDHPLLRRTLEEGTDSAYRLILRNYFLDGNQTSVGEAATLNQTPYREGSGFRYYADGWGLRLCRRLDGLAFTGRIHELLDTFFDAKGLAISRLDAVVHHYGKTFKDREDFKRTYYLGLAEKEARARPDDPQLWFNLLQQAMCASDWGLTLEASQRYLKLEAKAPPLVRLGAGMGLQFAGRLEESLACFDTILGAQPDHAAALTRKAISLGALGRPDDARRNFRAAIEAQPGFITPCVNLAELESRFGNASAARQALLSGLAVTPEEPLLLHALVQLSIEQQQIGQAAQDAWMAIQRCPNGGQGTWHRLVAHTLMKAGNQPQARAVAQLGLAAFPDDDELKRLVESLAPPG
jgi:tetratricopeptide (TPR) repeat protein